MLRRSFFSKLYLSYALLVVVCATSIGFLTLETARHNTLQQTQSTLYGTAQLLAALEAANPAHLWSAELPRHLQEVAADTGLHLTLLFANGALAAEAPRTLDPEEPFDALPEFKGIREATTPSFVRRVTGTGVDYLFMVTPILLEFEVIGYVRVGTPFAVVSTRLLELQQRVLAGACLGALVALILGWFIGRSVTKPLEVIGTACQELAAGRFDARVQLRREDEFGTVAATINEMAEEILRHVSIEQRERERLATLLSVMTDGVVAVNARGQTAYVNQEASRLLGLDPTTALGRPFQPQVLQLGVAAIYEEVASTQARATRELRIKGHPHDRVMRVEATPLRDSSAQKFGVLLVLHDLTEFRRLEEVRRTFTANVSHELKTPLAAISSLVDAMLEDDAMPSPLRRRFLEKISRQNDRLHELVKDMLMIARLESDRAELALRPICLSELLLESLHTFTEIARQKGIQLSSTIPAEIHVLADSEAVRLIANNLLHNALTYTAEGGTIDLTLSALAGRARFSVRDTGVGIPPEHLERIFERFYRVESARSSGGGSGLGLSIVKHLTQAVGGTVQVESTVGMGSVFIVEVPLARELPAADPDISSSFPQAAAGREN